MKVTTRSADDWPALGVAVSFAHAGRRDARPDVVVSAATEKVTRLPAAEKVLDGAAPTMRCCARRRSRGGGGAIIADARGSAAYKKELLRVYLGRAIQQALAGSARWDTR